MFQLDMVAEAITTDLFEGRVARRAAPDIRVVMRRFEPMNDRSMIV